MQCALKWRDLCTFGVVLSQVRLMTLLLARKLGTCRVEPEVPWCRDFWCFLLPGYFGTYLTRAEQTREATQRLC
jgi:hypothetical protein